MEAVYLTVKEVQKHLRIGATKMNQLLKEEGFPIVRLGRKILIPNDKLEQWINKRNDVTR
jgi:excisionase family DNA binding protein